MSSSWKTPNQVGTSTNTSSSTPPSYVTQAQQNMLGLAGGLTAPFASNVPNYSLAGFTPDQEAAFQLARYNAQQAYTTPPVSVPQFGPHTISGPPVAQAAQTSPQALGVGDIRQFFNPYQQDVVNTTQQQLTEANDRQLAAIRARQGAEGAYGGNRGALETTEQNRNFGNTLANTVAGLNQSGWNNAANLGMGNAQMRQQTALANMANQQQTSLQNAAWLQQSNMFNAQQSLQAAQLQNQMNQTPWQYQMQSLQGLLGAGNQEQQFAQQALNVPYTALDILRGVVPSQYGSSGTTTQPIYGPSTAQSLTSLGTLGLGLLSDKKEKKDIQKLGKDPKTDLPMYAYRYKDAPTNTPKVVGPMAQDVEKKYPGSTQKIGGTMVIKAGAAKKILGV